MTDLSKSQKKHLRQIAGQCYEKEMSIALNALYDNFKKWETSEISLWELNDKIHEYHNQTARDLWKNYEQMNDPGLSVAFALANGIIDIDLVNEDCREMLERKIDAFQFNDLKGDKI